MKFKIRRISTRFALILAGAALLPLVIFGIVSILAGSVPRHLRYVRQLGLAARFAGDLPIGLGVTELADEGKTLVRMSAIGAELRDHYGADVLVLGCAGMARYRQQIEQAIGLPVVDPTQAAVTMAIGAVRLAAADAAAPGLRPQASAES